MIYEMLPKSSENISYKMTFLKKENVVLYFIVLWLLEVCEVSSELWGNAG